MKNLTIYDVYVKMQDQWQCDRMLQLCKDYNLPYWDDYKAFLFYEEESHNLFEFFYDEFAVYIGDTNKTEVTEEQFIQMLKDR